MNSIKKNFLYNSALTISGYLFPLITYPYVSRVLGVSNIGICNFVDSIINYFTLFSMMGISAVGMRVISQNRDDRKEMSRHFTGLLVLNLITTTLAIVALLVSMYTVEKLFPYRDLLYIGVCKLFFNFFLIEWFYAGVEDFKYITKRSLVVRSLFVVAVFVFIQDADDYKTYYLLSAFIYLLNGIINIFYCRKYVDFTISGIRIKPYVTTFLTIGFYMLITNIYTSLNVTWLGFATNADEVGYYTTATKLYTIILAMFTALTNVVYPRVTYLYSKGMENEFWEKIRTVVDMVFAVSIPIVIALMVFSPDMIHLLAGEGYEGAYTPFRIIAPLVLIVGYEQVLVIQILMATKHDRQITINSVIGATVSILMNLIMISRFGAVGTAIVWVCTELTIAILSLKDIHHFTPYRFPARQFLKNILFYIPLLFILVAFKEFMALPSIISLSIAGILTLLYSLYIQTRWLKSQIILQTLDSLHRRITTYIKK